MTPTVPSGFAIVRGSCSPRLHWSRSPVIGRIRRKPGTSGRAEFRIHPKEAPANAGSARSFDAITDAKPTQLSDVCVGQFLIAILPSRHMGAHGSKDGVL